MSRGISEISAEWRIAHLAQLGVGYLLDIILPNLGLMDGVFDWVDRGEKEIVLGSELELFIPGLPGEDAV